MQDDKLGIVVAGAGPAGLIAALALAASGRDVTLLGTGPAPAARRTTALMVPALSLLAEFGVVERLESAAAPLRTMRIVDATGRLLRAPTVTFRAAEIGEERFGLNIPNGHLNTVLAEAVEAHPRVAWKKSNVAAWDLTETAALGRLDDGTEVAASLVVAADGRNSLARQRANIHATRTELPQAALVTNIEHSREHGGISTEFHKVTGPFTQVPLPGRRSSIVWVERPETAELLRELEAEALARRIEDRMDSMLGKVSLAGPRQVWRLAHGRPDRFAARRVALVGEAAHVIPPIGAQGLNLSVADIRTLVDIVAREGDDPGARGVLEEYDRRRRIDILARSTAVNLLNHSLLSGFLPAQALRAAGLATLAAFPPLRAFFMREGLRPGSGFGALAGIVRADRGLGKQVGRQ